MIKGKGEIMSVFRVEKNNNYTVMANYHLKLKVCYHICLVCLKIGIIH